MSHLVALSVFDSTWKVTKKVIRKKVLNGVLQNVDEGLGIPFRPNLSVNNRNFD